MSLENITVNGKPLKRIFYKPRRSQSARTKSGVTIYQNGQIETSVIIAGLVFPWVAKAPYVRSGESILGAIEYNEGRDKIKCHECGEWMRQIGTHLHRTHGLSASAYRLKHGLGQKAKLKTPKMISELKPTIRNLHPRTSFPKSALGRAHQVRRSQYALVREAGFGSRPELLNLRNQCFAQISQRVKDLAIQLGHTPTKQEMRDIGIWAETIPRKFGIRTREFLSLIGLKPRTPAEFGRLGGYAKAAVVRQGAV